MSDIVDDMRKQFSSDDGMSLNTAKVLDDAADEIESLREQLATAQAAYLQFTQASDAKLAKAVAALGEIASKNDLERIVDEVLESAARNALYECEMIARDALKEITK